MPAILFGSIGTLAETSELQRRSFNLAFAVHGLGWEWGREHYQSLLRQAGGAQRVGDYAASRGEAVDAAAVHATKSELFRAALAAADLAPRPGVAETVAAAQEAGLALGLVSTTSPENVAALGAALRAGVDLGGFAVVLDATTAGAAKPDPAPYTTALGRLGLAADDCVAVEDNADGVASAAAAGVRCVAFPGANTARHGYEEAERTVEALDPALLLRLVGQR